MTTEGRNIEETADDADARFADYEYLSYWEDERVVETYRRLSHDLRQRGFDQATVHRMGCIEEELRARELNPDEIAMDVEK